MKKLLYKLFVKNRVIDFISAPALSIIVPPLVGLYYGTLDIWGDDWEIVKNYKEIHEFLFVSLAIFTVFILFAKGLSEYFKGKISRQYNDILESIIVFFNEVVKKKRDRFYKKAKNIKPNADIFKIISHPTDQIEYVIDGTKRLLHQGFGIHEKNIDITIIQGNPAENKWWFKFKCNSQKQHTKAGTIMQKDSTASYCYQKGVSIFIPDKRKGLKEQVFIDTERSKEHEYGSIYCKPVRINVGSVEFVFIFTIAIYGEFLCTPYDEEECRACERLLDEIADRIELELYLFSMKEFKTNGGKSK